MLRIVRKSQTPEETKEGVLLAMARHNYAPHATHIETLECLIHFQTRFPGSIYASYDDIARRLGKSPGSVKYRMNKLVRDFEGYVKIDQTRSISIKTGRAVRKRRITINWPGLIRAMVKEREEVLCVGPEDSGTIGRFFKNTGS